MKLSQLDFNKIRRLRWTIKNVGGVTYNTVLNQTEVRLFWLDFMRNVFAPRFKRQNAILKIEHFDTTQPVLITDELDIQLPSELETALYYEANQHAPPVRCAIALTQTIVLALGVISLILIATLYWWLSSSPAALSSSSSSHKNSRLRNLLISRII